MNGQKYTVEFDATIRGVIVRVEGYVMADYGGVYHRGVEVYVNGEEVTGLLSVDDITALEDQVESVAVLEYYGG
jgi:hypothetical protein